MACRIPKGTVGFFIQGHFLTNTWVFPNIVVPQNGWFIREKTLLELMIWGTPIFGSIHIGTVSHVTFPSFGSPNCTALQADDLIFHATEVRMIDHRRVGGGKF